MQLKLYANNGKNDFWMLSQNDFSNFDQPLLEF